MNKYQEALNNLIKNSCPKRTYCEKCYFENVCNCDAKQNINVLQELTDNQPLKFEELEKGMWVWDDKEKWYRKIVILFNPCSEYPKGSFKSYADSCETSLDFIEFKENRFYRREVTDEKIQ